MRRAPVLLVLLLAACSSGSPKALDSPSPSPSELSPSPTASATRAAVASPAPTGARVTPSPTRSPAAARLPSPSAKPGHTQAPSPAPKPKPAPSPTRVGQTFTIDEVAPDRFSPRALTIRVGDSVLVTNEDVASHTFTLPSLSKDSGNMDSGDTYRLRFARAGTFDFVCTYHEDVGMTGQVTVKP